MEKQELLDEWSMVNGYLRAILKTENDNKTRLDILKEISKNNDIYSYELYKINKLLG